MQSTQYGNAMHVAIIMDGNGRWATERGRPRTDGHRAGADAVRRVVEAAPELGIGVLTVYAFSSDNWKRPPGEVRALMSMFDQYLRSEVRGCASNGIRISVIGRRDRLSRVVRRSIEVAEGATCRGEKLHLRIAIDYSSREMIVQAASRLAAGQAVSREAFGELLAENAPAPEVDLLIRTGGEQRLSDFLLWECAYAELYFSGTKWPDFGREDLEAALRAYAGRERRFGAVPEVQLSATGT